MPSAARIKVCSQVMACAPPWNEGGNMMRKSLLGLAVGAALAVSMSAANAQSFATDYRGGYSSSNREVFNDRREISGDRAEIRRDNREIAGDRRELSNDYRERAQ